MFTFNFKKQFANDVELGIKRQTIRAERKDKKRPQPGEAIRHYTGMRSTTCRKLLDSICIECLPVHIDHDDKEIVIIVGGERLTHAESIELAKLDGFNSRAELIGFFNETHGLPFNGFLVRW